MLWKQYLKVIPSKSPHLYDTRRKRLNVLWVKVFKNGQNQKFGEDSL